MVKSLLHLTLLRVKCHGLLWRLPQQQADVTARQAGRPVTSQGLTRVPLLML